MILSDYLSRHRQKDLDPSELISISFCCLKVCRGFIDDKIGEDIFCIKTRSSAKTSGNEVGEVHGANKLLDPNYKPEHQSKSKLPSVTRKLSPIKTPRKPILKTLARPTPKVLATPKSVRIQSGTVNDMLTPISSPTSMVTPVSVYGGASCFYSLPPPTIGAKKNTFFYTIGGNGENMDRRDVLIRNIEEKRKIIEEQNRKIFHPPSVEGINVGVTEGLETLDPEIRIPTEEDFVLPPPLESLLDKAKTAYKFLPKQGDIDRLIAKINKKVLRDMNLCVDMKTSKSSIFDKFTF